MLLLAASSYSLGIRAAGKSKLALLYQREKETQKQPFGFTEGRIWDFSPLPMNIRAPAYMGYDYTAIWKFCELEAALSLTSYKEEAAGEVFQQRDTGAAIWLEVTVFT